MAGVFGRLAPFTTASACYSVDVIVSFSPESERIWTRLAALNEEFFKHMGRLHSMAAQDRTSYEATMAQCGSLCYDEVRRQLPHACSSAI